MTLFSRDWLARYAQRVEADTEMAAIGRWFTTALSVAAGDRRVVLRFEAGRLAEFVEAPRLDVRAAFGFRAAPEIWAKFLAPHPEPLYHDVFAMLMRVPGFVLEGDTLVAMQHARALHRAMRLMREVEADVDAANRTPAPHAPAAPIIAQPSGVEPIVGRYLNLEIDGVPHRVFVEEAGAGPPLLCLHTAGADSRQYRHLLNDAVITARSRAIAFDMPYHGRSNPPAGWWRHRHLLTTAGYVAAIRAVWAALGLERPVVLGCSMGGAIVLALAAEYQRELRGVIGLESAAFAPDATMTSCITRRSTAASSWPVTFTASVPRGVRRRARARTGGTTASPVPASTRLTCTSTASTGTLASWSRRSTPASVRFLC